MEISPDEVINDWMVTVGRYFKDPTADWESCVRDVLCEDRFILPGTRRVDDDCDGRIDEKTLQEPAGGDFATAPQLSIPGEARAQVLVRGVPAAGITSPQPFVSP